MPPRTAISSYLVARYSQPFRSLQTTPPSPLPTYLLPPSLSASTSSLPSSPTPLPQLPPHLPALHPSTSPLSLPSTTTSALSLIRSQSTSSTGIYLLARLHARTYLLHPRDILTLPTLRPLQPPGTTLALTRILEVGSRDYAIRAPAAEAKEVRKELDFDFDEVKKLPTVPGWVARCELTVLEHTRSPMEVMLKKKRRKGYQRTIRSKQGWTRLRVGDIILGEGESTIAAATMEETTA